MISYARAACKTWSIWPFPCGGGANRSVCFAWDGQFFAKNLLGVTHLHDGSLATHRGTSPPYCGLPAIKRWDGIGTSHRSGAFRRAKTVMRASSFQMRAN